MGLTREEAIEGHRKQFEWLAEKCRETLWVKGKSFYFSENNLHQHKDNSYLCQFAFENSSLTDKDGNKIKDCRLCPIDKKANGCEEYQCPVLGYEYYYDEEEVSKYWAAAECATRCANLIMKGE